MLKPSLISFFAAANKILMGADAASAQTKKLPTTTTTVIITNCNLINRPLNARYTILTLF